jgi:sugar phosphate isomerase/epimerase
VVEALDDGLDGSLGDIAWDETFAALRDVTFDGIAAVCVFGWEEDADAIHRRMLDRVTSELVPRQHPSALTRQMCDPG